MLETNKCPACKHVYEITWDDDNTEYFHDVDEYEDTVDEFEELYPEFCPFCGIHRDYTSECDSCDELP